MSVNGNSSLRELMDHPEVGKLRKKEFTLLSAFGDPDEMRIILCWDQ